MSNQIETDEERKRRAKREKMKRYRANRAARDAQGIAPDQEFAAYARRAWSGSEEKPAPRSPRRTPVESTRQEEGSTSGWAVLASIGVAIIVIPVVAGLAIRHYMEQ